MQLKLDQPFQLHRSGWRTSLMAVSYAVVLTTALTTMILLRAGDSEAAAERQPLPVSTERFQLESGYTREVSFLGLTRAARKTRLGFEVPGTVAELKVREGTAVEAGQILAELDTAQLLARRAATTAEQERVAAQLELAALRAKRQKDLSASGAVSQQDWDETRLSEKALAAQLQAVAAQLQGIDIDLEKSVLRAPYDGVVAERFVNTGAVVSNGAPVVRLVASGEREAHIGIAVEKATQLVEGEYYPLTLRGEVLQSRLRSVRPDVDPLTLTTTAVFELPADTRALDGEPVSLTLTEPVQLAGGWLPIAALIEGERGIWTVLRVAEQDGHTVTAREAVEVLEIRGDRVFVRGTLRDRQLLIKDGVHRIAPGTAVEPIELTEPLES